jgi:hypothetical protein
MTLTLPSNETKTLPLYSDANPGEIAFEFCKENNLSFDYLINLKEYITNLIYSYNEQQQENSKQKDIIQYRNSYINNDGSDISINKVIKNPISKSISHLAESKTTHYKPTNLFPYEFSIENTYVKNHHNNISMTRAKSYNKHLTVSITSHNSNYGGNCYPTTTKSSPKQTSMSFVNKTQTGLEKSLVIKKHSNIFEKLFNDSKYKQITYKRPCHFSKQFVYPKRPNSQQKLTSFSSNSISIQTFNTLQQMENSSKEDDKTKDYSNAYILHPTQVNSGIKVYSFRPNITPIKPFHNKTPKTTQLYKNPTNIKESSSIPKNSIRYNSNSCSKRINKTCKKPTMSTSLYKPLKERTIHINKRTNRSIEQIKKEALINLFNELKGSYRNTINNNILNRESIQLKNIPQSIQNLIEYVIDSVINKNEEFTLDSFLETMDFIFKKIPPESQQIIINTYKPKQEIKGSRHNSIINNMKIINSNTNNINNSKTSFYKNPRYDNKLYKK